MYDTNLIKVKFAMRGLPKENASSIATSQSDCARILQDANISCLKYKREQSLYCGIYVFGEKSSKKDEKERIWMERRVTWDLNFANGAEVSTCQHLLADYCFGAFIFKKKENLNASYTRAGSSIIQKI